MLIQASTSDGRPLHHNHRPQSPTHHWSQRWWLSLSFLLYLFSFQFSSLTVITHCRTAIHAFPIHYSVFHLWFQSSSNKVCCYINYLAFFNFNPPQGILQQQTWLPCSETTHNIIPQQKEQHTHKIVLSRGCTDLIGTTCILLGKKRVYFITALFVNPLLELAQIFPKQHQWYSYSKILI